MNKKILLTLILGMFFISMASAEIQTLGTFKQGDDINLIQTCASCTFNNITSVLDPKGNQVIGEFGMTKVGTVYNFTLTSGNATILGTYIYNGVGDIGGTNTIWNIDFILTADGNPFEAFPNQFGVILFGFILIMFGLLNVRYTLLKHMGSMILMVMGVLTLYPGYNFINHTTLFGLALGSALVGIGFWFLVEDSFSRTGQEERYYQDQGDTEEEFDE